MGVRIIYGKPGTGKSEFCFLDILKQINKEKKIYMITPEQFSLTAEKKLMNIIEKKAVVNAEIITLSRMAYRILNEVGGSTRVHLSKCGKAMLVYSILSKYKKNFNFLGKSEENIDLAIKAITEFKKHGISVEYLNTEISKTDNPLLKSKLSDITLIYEKFEEKIDGKYIEETDLLTLLSEKIEHSEFIKDSIIYLDEFSGFTSQEYEVLKQFIKYSKQCNITICADSINSGTNPDIDIFYSNKQTISKILDLIDNNKFKLEETISLDNVYRFKTQELKHLSENICNIKYKTYEKDVENIEMFLAKNQYSEIENIAKRIIKLVQNKEMRFKDISIITKNIENYSSLVRAIFSKYEIPVFIDEKRDLNQNVIIQYVLSIIDILAKNFNTDAVFNYLKLGFSEIEMDEIFALENYCTKWGIKNNKWKNDFTYEIDDENKKAQIQRWNDLRKKIINPLLDIKEKIKETKTVENISKILYQFIQEQQIEKKILDKMNELEEKGLIDFANEYYTSYKVLLEIFDEMVLVFNEDKINLEQYSKIFKIGLKNSGLGKIPGTQDQVIFGDVERSRTHKVKIVFIIGVNDGVFPSVNKDEGFFNDEDRNVLKTDGIELAKGTIENLYEDNFNIYKAFTTAEEKLYLSYASSDSQGKSLRPSIYIHKIKKIYPKLKEESDVVNKKYDIINEKVTYEELLENISNLKKGENISKIWYPIYNYYKNKENWNNLLQQDLKGLIYTNQPNDINEGNIQNLYGNTLYTSISKLEKYKSCPFSYYLQYGLKLKQKEEFKIYSFDTGSFMHEIIDCFFERVKEEDYNLSELEDDTIKSIVAKIVDEKLKLAKNTKFNATAKYKLLVERLKKLISKALKYIIQTIIYSDFSIKGTEIEFGKRGEYKPIILTLEDGKNVEITGKIDRVDTAVSDENEKYLRIIDYKSSVKNIDLNEVYAGIQIQLLTYADAICKEEDVMPAGLFYFSLLDKMIPLDKKISSEELEEKIRKNFKMKGLIIADVKIIKMNDNTLTSGTSKIVPAAITSTGNINQKNTNGVTKEEFKILQDYISITIKKIAREIFSGKIEIKPYNKKGKTPCEYCEYKIICGFDRNCNQYNYIDKKSKDDIILKMKEGNK